MSNPNPVNLTASVEAKLKNICKEQNIDYRFILIRYATERFLYRLSVSKYAKQFVLKGGNLFIIWQNGKNYRPTVDSDLLWCGNESEDKLKSIFTELCDFLNNPKDGIRYDADSIKVIPILQEVEHAGTRITLLAFLGNARIALQFDIGTADVITPPAEYADFPVLLNNVAPRLRIYPRETVIAEKFETMVSKGNLNSRMKDFYDIWLLTELFCFNFQTLQQAVLNTFSRRNINLPTSTPECFTDEFYASSIKNKQWNAFCRKNNIKQLSDSFELAVLRIKAFLEPVFMYSNDRKNKWYAGKGWQ